MLFLDDFYGDIFRPSRINQPDLCNGKKLKRHRSNDSDSLEIVSKLIIKCTHAKEQSPENASIFLGTWSKEFE